MYPSGHCGASPVPPKELGHTVTGSHNRTGSTGESVRSVEEIAQEIAEVVQGA
jgi:hypothetical protein